MLYLKIAGLSCQNDNTFIEGLFGMCYNIHTKYKWNKWTNGK